ncbi:MAG: translation initiation factor IF-2 [Candidatus Micrarchaeota archaeon]
MLRQPIVTILGHVDAGKTTLLDSIRETGVAGREAGGITQAVGASIIPIEAIESTCGGLKNKLKVNFTIPGLLFIDTPGHEAFANLRKRGGSIADIVVLIVDINKGIEPQTLESIGLLKQYKTPFIIAATKIDNITGWKKQINKCISESFTSQRQDVMDRLDEKLYELVGQLSMQGINSERFDRVTEFTKQVLIVPVSSHSKEGLQELLLYVAGLAQRYLEKRLELHESEPGKGAILEVKEERGLGKTLDVILYDGVLRESDEVAFATIDGSPISGKIKAILQPKPLDEMRDPREKFNRVEMASAATGVKIACEFADQALPGSSFYVVRDNREKLFALLEKEFREIVVESEENGVMLKADALGSLEAIAKIFAIAKIPVRSAKIGGITTKDVAEAASVANADKLLGVIFSFNVPVPDEIKQDLETNKVKLFEENIIYNLVENYQRWVVEEKANERKKAFEQLAFPGELKILPGCCFRVSHPLICGVEMLGGRLRKGVKLINEANEEIATVRAIQHEKKEVDAATKGQQIAISLDGATFGRQIKEKQVLYVDIPKEDIILLEKKFATSLSPDEKDLLARLKKIKGIASFKF